MNLGKYFSRRRRDAEFAREIEAHIKIEVDENLGRGLSPEEARRQACLKFGSPRRVREEEWEHSTIRFFDDLWRDCKYSARTLWRTPGFAIVAIVVMALGIGANTALFTIVRSVLLKPLPYPHSDRLVSVYERVEHSKSPSPWLPVDAGSFGVWKHSAQHLAELALICPWEQYNVSAGNRQLPETIAAAWISANLFHTLAVAPMLGRDFTAQDDQPSAQATVILSSSFWKRRFAGDPAIIGKSIWLYAKQYTVIGVMPPSFTYPTAKIQVWTPVYHEARPELIATFADHEFIVLARLFPGVTMASLASQLDTVQKEIAHQHPEPAVHDGAIARSLLDDTVEDFKTPLYAMLAATACVLLIACLNVANLLIARSAARQHDLAIRSALGGSRWRLIREHLAEGLVLSACGGAGGLLLAYAALAWLAHTSLDLARAEAIHIDGTVLLFVVALVTLCGVLAGLVPSLTLRPKHLLETLQQSSRSQSGSSDRVRARKALLAAEVGLTVVLLTAAGLLIKSYQRLRTTDIGMPTDNVLSLSFSLPEVHYTKPPQIVAFFEQLITRVRAVPGVTAAGLVTAAPGEGWGGDISAFVAEHPPVSPDQWADLMHRGVDPGYFSAMQIPLIRGRFFTSQERLGYDRTTIISQTAARQLFPNEDPIGRHIKLEDGSANEIVGVVGDTRWLVSQTVRPTMYLPLFNGDYSHATLLVRSNHDVQTLAVPIQKIIGALDPDLPVSDVMTVEQNIGRSTQQAAVNSALVLAFAIIALLLAAVGLYGVLSYLATQRTSEIGIRIALGAQRSSVVRLLLFDGLTPAWVGLVLGLIGSAFTVQLIRNMLYGAQPLDWTIFAAVAALLIVVAATACAIPAWRASRLNPVQALRME
jgi:predicted permease